MLGPYANDQGAKLPWRKKVGIRPNFFGGEARQESLLPIALILNPIRTLAPALPCAGHFEALGCRGTVVLRHHQQWNFWMNIQEGEIRTLSVHLKPASA